MSDDDAYPPAHPAFTEHFTDEIYTDWADDMAPFGGDEAADVVAEWYEDLDELTPTTTLSDLLLVSLEGDWPEILDDPDALAEFGDAVIIALGFMLIRITGRIDDAGRATLAHAIGRRAALFPDEESFGTMAHDLDTFEG